MRSLELGADDYLVKPFAFAELLARVRSLLRRGSGRPEPEILRVEDLEIDTVRFKATRGSTPLDLTAKEFLLLAFLARRARQVVSRTAIAGEVWDINFDCESNVVDVAIHRLRRKVNDPFAPKLLHTVRGVGSALRPPRANCRPETTSSNTRRAPASRRRQRWPSKSWLAVGHPGVTEQGTKPVRDGDCGNGERPKSDDCGIMPWNPAEKGLGRP